MRPVQGWPLTGLGCDRGYNAGAPTGLRAELDML